MESSSYRLDWFERWAQYQPEHIAIVDTGENQSYSYGRIHQDAEKAIGLLQDELKLRPGSRIAFLGEFSGLFTLLFSVCQKHRFCLVPLNYRLSSAEIGYLLESTEPGLLIYDSKFTPTIEQLASIQGKRLTTISSEDFLSRLEEYSSSNQIHQPPQITDPIFLLFTSGTTGRPKVVPYTHEMLTWNSIDTSWRLNIDSEDVTVLCMPPFHTGGLNVLFAPMLHRGATVVLQPKFQASETLLLLENYKASVYMAVPTIVKMMAEAGEFDKVELKKLRYMVVGGEALPMPLIQKWEAKGIKIRQGYGLTEAGPSITSLHHDDCLRKRGSIGKFNFYVEAKLVSEDGIQVPKGTAGELWLKGPSVMKGYWNNPEANQKSFVKGWFKTGDMMKEDEQGFLYMVDRIKNMYKSGGENIYPAEIEKVLLEHTSIAEAAVIGVKDEKWGEVGKAFVVMREGNAFSEEEILLFLSGKLAKFKLPRYFECLDKLPLNETGKVDRKRLLGKT
jgi:fatty-acyl-CoA synthase